MPPNTDSESPKLGDMKYDYKQLANPYKEQGGQCFEECSVTSGGGQGTRQLEQEELPENPLRISTRARQTYELYRYDRNAMMILSQLDDRGLAGGLIDRLKTTLERFRFVVDVHYASNPGDFYEKCTQFFESDFSECGAVALAVVTSMARGGPTPINRTRRNRMSYDESRIVQNIETSRNPTLAVKPKIYINLDDHQHGRCVELSRPIHGNIVALHVSLLSGYMSSVFRRPKSAVYRQISSHFAKKGAMLDLLCDNMTAKCDTNNMISIITDSAMEFESKVCKDSRTRATPFYTSTSVMWTFDKELYLIRAAD